MPDPKSPGTATPPPILGEGCTARYDIDALSEEDGTEFPGAAELWQQLQKSGEDEEPSDDA
ncbi:hypothetical protein D9M71_92580 [compost metagenome]